MQLKDWLNSINFTKKNLLEEDPTAKYPAFVVNKCLSGTLDSVLFANEMNMNAHLDKELQYDFYLQSLRKRKRFAPWLKKGKVEDIDAVKKYYGYSTEKAEQALRILTRSQIDYIKQKQYTGGMV